MLPLFESFYSEIWANMLRKRTIMFSEGLTTLGFDNNSSNSAQESSPNQDSYDSSDDFSANKWSTSKKMARNIVFQVHMGPNDVFDQGHVINQNISTQQT